MKIALFDPYLLKFTSGMISWWGENGYEVKFSQYYDPKLVEWADVLFFDTIDNNTLSATNPGEAILADDSNFKPWGLGGHDMTNKKVIVRPIDIEVWQQHYMSIDWTYINDVIFIAPHIRNLVELETLMGWHKGIGVHTIPHSVDLDAWTFKERKPGFDIAVVSERWISKGTSEILQIALKLKQIDKRYKIHWLGQRSDYQWEHAYRDEFVEHHKLNIEFTNFVDSVDEFLEDKNYLLHASHKEAFSMATAEAMAKGIKPVLHRFFGADALWPGLCWSSIDEAVDMITSSEYDSHSYKQYLIDQGYSLPQMMKKLDKIIKKGK